MLIMPHVDKHLAGFLFTSCVGVAGRMLDLELKGAVKMLDPMFETTWRKIPFILEMTAEFQNKYMQRSQSSMKNAQAAAEAAAFNMFLAELSSDQAVHRSRVAKAASDQAKRRSQLLQTLEDYHNTAWNCVQEAMDLVSPTWFIRTKDCSTALPAKLQPWIHQAPLTLHVFMAMFFIVSCAQSLPH